MKNNFYIKILSSVILTLFSLTVSAEENVSEHQYNFYTGNFDFSDNKQKAILFGFQHQNENLERNTFLGNASPITGGFITENRSEEHTSELQSRSDLVCRVLLEKKKESLKEK